MYLDHTYNLIECLGIPSPRSLWRTPPSAVREENSGKRSFWPLPIHRPIRCDPGDRGAKTAHEDLCANPYPPADSLRSWGTVSKSSTVGERFSIDARRRGATAVT